jgi:hypothetical protein
LVATSIDRSLSRESQQLQQQQGLSSSYDFLVAVLQYHCPATAELQAAVIRLLLEVNAPEDVEGSTIALAADRGWKGYRRWRYGS